MPIEEIEPPFDLGIFLCMHEILYAYISADAHKTNEFVFIVWIIMYLSIFVMELNVVQ